MCAALLLAAAPLAPASAIDFTLDSLGVTGSLRTQLAVGAAMRMQGRDQNLIGKLNLPGQEQFCEDKDPSGAVGPAAQPPGQNCQNVAGNAAYLALPGYPSVNLDNGDLNYNRHDLTTASIKATPRLQLTRENFGLDVSAVYLYDAVNSGFTEYHPNNLQDNNGFQDRNTRRRADAERQIGSVIRLLDAYVSGNLPLPGDRQLAFKLGNQLLSIGTSTTMVLNSLNVVNPPDANTATRPGSDVREVFQRIPLLDVSTNLNESLSVETFYAFRWKPVLAPPIGSYLSTNDLLGAGKGYAMALFGKYREDPEDLMGVEDRTQGNVNLISEAGRTVGVDPAITPRNGGEYGATLTYFAQELANTTFTLTYMNLHNRLPIVAFRASAQGCTYNSTNATEAATDCQGFKTAANNNSGLEITPVDTVRVVAEYPENVHALGTSVSTNLGAVSLTGEVVYRPNQPLQVDAADLSFAALQPMLPGTTFLLLPGTNDPSRRNACPDFVETLYRHEVVQPGQLIHGYERFKTLNYNASILLLAGASDNPFGADQLTLLSEVGAFHVLDMPSLDQLQLAAPGTYFHHSAGVDGTGTPNADQSSSGAAPQDRLNPSYQAGGFATAFSWGYRVLSQLSYEEVLPGVKVAPQMSFFHDVHGRAALPAAEFVQGRKQASLGLNATYHNSWSGTVRYFWYLGGGTANLLSDRDNLQLSVSYDF